MKEVRAGRLITPDEELKDASVRIEDGRIVAVRTAGGGAGPGGAVSPRGPHDSGGPRGPDDPGGPSDPGGSGGPGADETAEVALGEHRNRIAGETVDELIDASALTVIPGLIDVHTHGADGVQAIDGTTEALRRMARFYARHGVTGFLAGVFGSREQIEAGIDAAVAYQDVGHDGVKIPSHTARAGAALLGIYLEGPFLNRAWAGAFVPDTIVPPDVELLAGYLDRAKGSIRLLTLAPEVAGADALVALARDRGVVCSLGHTDAAFEQALDAASKGVRHVAHTFNAMRGLHHREPGALGAALTDGRFTVEIIVDGIHVHPAAVRLLTRAKGRDAVVLITDSIAAAGLPDGDYAFRDVSVRVRGDAARLDDGTLAGSTLTMERGVANLVAFGAATTSEAVSMGSTNPARLLGLGGSKGRVAVGHDADLVALTDSFEVAWTMVGGELVYQA